MRLRVPAVLVCSMLAVPCVAVPAARAQTAPSPWEVFARRAGEPAWGPLVRLDSLDAVWKRDPAWARALPQPRAQVLAQLGLHREALRAWDEQGAPSREPGRLPAGVQALPAVDVIAAAAETSRVVIVNERHHAACDRLLTRALLEPLHARGFRWLALEALDAADTALASRGGPLDERSGYYLGEPLFAELVREALALGWHVVPYEQEPADSARFAELPAKLRRDRVQAEHLIERVLRADPAARVLVHAGWAHAHEQVTADWHPLAAWLHELAGVDPLTVDQTALGERGSRRAEHPARQMAAALGLVGDEPVVLADSTGRPLHVTDVPVDLEVLGPRTRLVNGRPAWLALGGRRVLTRVPVPEGRDAEVWVEAWAAGQSDDETPLDRTRVQRAEAAWLWLPPGAPVWVRIADEPGNTLRTTEAAGAGAASP